MNNKLTVGDVPTIKSYKYTSDIRLQVSDYDKYEQYIDIEKLYHGKKDDKNMRLGLFKDEERDLRAVPGLSVICGMTGHGKSMLGNSLAYKAVKEGYNVLYITLEVNKEDMFYQMLSIKSFVDGPGGLDKAISHSDIKRKALRPEQESYLFKELWPQFKEMKGNLHILSEFDFNVNDTLSMQQKMMEVENYSIAKSGKGIDMIIVDYIQLFKMYTRNQNIGSGEYAVLTNWVNDFRKLSLNYLGENREIPIILLSQLNRDAWSDEKYRQKQIAKNSMSVQFVPANSNTRQVNVPEIVLNISQIAGCTEIAKAAKQIITIYSDDGLKASNQCLISVLKNRNGETHNTQHLTYMNPKYYVVGYNTECKDTFNGALADILDDSETLNLNAICAGSSDPFATMGEL